MKTFENIKALKLNTAKKCVAAIAAVSLVSCALFAEAADTDANATDALAQHKYHGDYEAKRGPHSKADCGHGKADGDYGRPFWGAKLNLTDAQKESLKAARAAAQTSTQDLHEKLRAAHAALDKAISVNADDAMLNKLATDLASVVAQKELAHAKARRDFINVLTPEQKQKLEAFIADAKNAPREPRLRDQERGAHKDQAPSKN